MNQPHEKIDQAQEQERAWSAAGGLAGFLLVLGLGAFTFFAASTPPQGTHAATRQAPAATAQPEEPVSADSTRPGESIFASY